MNDIEKKEREYRKRVKDWHRIARTRKPHSCVAWWNARNSVKWKSLSNDERVIARQAWEKNNLQP